MKILVRVGPYLLKINITGVAVLAPTVTKIIRGIRRMSL